MLRCVASIQAQSLFYMPNPIATRLGAKAAFTPREIDALAEHITAFSLAGIHAVADSSDRRRQRGDAPVAARARLRSAGRRR